MTFTSMKYGRRWPDEFVFPKLDESGEWVYEDETGCFSEEVFPSKEKAIEVLLAYADTLDRVSDHPTDRSGK